MPTGLFTSYVVAVEFSAGVWTDITSSVTADSIEIRPGRANQTGGVQPGTLALELDNATGEWTPDNPLSARYPNFVEGKRIRVQVVVSATTYTRFVGRIDTIDPDFPQEPQQAKVAVGAVDLLGDLQRVTCDSLVKQSARLGSAQLRCYPLDDKSPRLSSRELQGRDGDLVVSGKVELAGDDSFGVDGADATVFTDGGSLTAVTNRGDWRTGVGLFTPTAVAFAFVKVTFGVAFDVLALEPSGGPGGNTVSIEWDGAQFTYTVVGGGTASRSMTPTRDGWHLVGFRVQDAITDTNQAILDTQVEAILLGGTLIGSTGELPILRLGGNGSGSIKDVWLPNTLTSDAVQYDLAYEAAYGGGLPFADAMTVLNSALPMANLGATIAATGTSTKTVSALATKDRSALDILADLAAVESGRVFHEYSTSATQTIRIVTSADDRPTTVSLTVDAELDLDGGPTLSRSNADTVVLISAESPTQAVTVADSLQTSSGSSSTLSSYRDSVAELRAQAEDQLAASRERHLRVSSMTVDLVSATSNLFASFFAMRIGSRVRLSNLPSAYFGVTYMDGYAEGWTERIGPSGYFVDFDLSPADAPPEWVWEDSTYGRWGWGDGICTLSSGITSSATSITLTWTGSATLSTSAGDYPLDIDLNGERITLPSAPAGGTSPRTFTGVTRGVAPTVARAHSAGETVEIWNAARWAM